MPRILVVEDEFLVRDFIVEELEIAGFEIEWSIDGEKALARLESGDRFDLLFTDVRMPGSIDGWELGRRAATLVPRMPIIYATGYSETTRPLLDNEGFLAKPYRIKDVLDMMSGMGIRN